MLQIVSGQSKDAEIVRQKYCMRVLTRKELKQRLPDQTSTKVPTCSPSTKRPRLPGLFMSNTMMGRLFSLHSVKAVMSITLRPFVVHLIE